MKYYIGKETGSDMMALQVKSPAARPDDLLSQAVLLPLPVPGIREQERGGGVEEKGGERDRGRDRDHF